LDCNWHLWHVPSKVPDIDCSWHFMVLYLGKIQDDVIFQAEIYAEALWPDQTLQQRRNARATLFPFNLFCTCAQPYRLTLKMPPDTSRAQTHTSSTKERKGGHGISGHQKQYGREGHESEGLRPLETSGRQGGCKPDTALHESQKLPSYRCGWLHGTTVDVRRRSKGRTVYLACLGRNLRCHL